VFIQTHETNSPKSSPKPGLNAGDFRTVVFIEHSSPPAEIVAKAGIEPMEIEAPGPACNLSYYWKGLRFLFRAGFVSGCSLSLIRRHGIVVARLARGLARHQGEKVLIWEYTHRNEQAVPFLARMFGYAVVAIPHNIEALVPTEAPVLSGLKGQQFRDEVKAFKAVNSIFTISREEQWFLAFYGLESFHLPYFPAAKIATRFFSVRSRRRGMTPKRLLILGHAGYPPTRAGMEELIRILLGFSRWGFTARGRGRV